MPQKDAKELLREQKAAEAIAQQQEQLKNKNARKKNVKEEEKDKETKEKAPLKPVTSLLYETSIYDFLQSIQKMQDYDFNFREKISGNIDEELMKENILSGERPEDDHRSEIAS